MPEVATTTPRPPTWGQPVPRDYARSLRAMTQRIQAAERTMDERSDLFARLRSEGYSLDSIAAAAGVHREAVRKSLLRREARGDKPVNAR